MSRPAWFEYDRPEQYECVTSTVEVPLRNGSHLVGDLSLPATGGQVAEGRFPCLVAHYTPYGRGPRREVIEWWARHGYATIVCDIRGSGDSPGMFPGCLSLGEAEDNYDLIEWMAVQPFSSGRVGQYGQSYGGMSSYRVAALRPPHLCAIAPQESYSSYYLHAAFPGGIEAGTGRNWANGVPNITKGRVTTEFQKMLWSVHPLIDDFWRQVDIDTKYGSIHVPVLGFGGWFDAFKEGMVRNQVGLRSRSWLLMGPWTHGIPHNMPVEPAPIGTLLAWFDHWLAGTDAPLPSARVTSYELPRASSRGWQELDDWPPSDATRLRLHLTVDRSLAKAPGSSGSQTYTVNPEDGPSASVGFGTDQPLPDSPEADLRESDAARLSFSTAPLNEDLVLAGPVTLHMRASLSAPDTNLVAKLMDVGADGRVNQASVGYLRASHRLGHDTIERLVPGKDYDYLLELEPVHWRFVASHRLRISVSSGDVPALVPDAAPGSVTIHCGEGGSFVDFWAHEGDPSLIG